MGSGLTLNNDLYDGMLQSLGRRRHLHLPRERPGPRAAAARPDTVIAYNCIHDIAGLARPRGVGITSTTSLQLRRGSQPDLQRPPTALTLNLTSQYNLVYNNTLAGEQSISSSPDRATARAWRGRTSRTTFSPPSTAPSNRRDGLRFQQQPSAPHAPGVRQSGRARTSNSCRTRRRWTPGMIIPGYTNGYVGSAPDIGCFEYGATPWIAGVRCGDERPTPRPFPPRRSIWPPPRLLRRKWISPGKTTTPTPQAAWCSGRPTRRSRHDPFPGYAAIGDVCLPGNAASYVDTTLGPAITASALQRVLRSRPTPTTSTPAAPLVPSADTIQAANFTAASGVPPAAAC